MIGHVYCGAFGYADDVALASPSMYGLKKMCDICEHFADDFNLQFNPVKSQLINFSNNTNLSFKFCGSDVTVSDTGIHLGHLVGPKVLPNAIRDMSNDLIRRVNAIMSNFSFCSLDIRRQLFMSYCTSFYGLCLFDLQAKELDKFYTSWRNAVRKICMLIA